MSSGNLLFVIFLAGAGFFLVCIVAFTFFSRFMRREKEAAQRFRDMHMTPPDER